MNASPLELELVMDTRPIIELLEPVAGQLERIQLTAQKLAEYVFSTWSSFDSSHLFYYNDGNPLVYLTHNACLDLLESAMMSRLAPHEQETIYKIVTNSLSILYLLGRHTFDRLELADHQLQTMQVLGWHGKALRLRLIY